MDYDTQNKSLIYNNDDDKYIMTDNKDDKINRLNKYKSNIKYIHYETVAKMIDGLTKDHMDNNFVLHNCCCNNTGYGYTDTKNTNNNNNNNLYIYYTDIDEKKLIVNFFENHGYLIENKEIEDTECVVGKKKYRIFSCYKQVDMQT